MKNPMVYIMTNKPQGTLYTGVTSNIFQRTFQHKNKDTPGFTSRYNCNLLVYYEIFSNMFDAIAREKQIKAGSRKQKILLITQMNPRWSDLYETL